MGAIPTVMPYWLAPKIAGFQSRYLEVEVHLVENITARLIEGLQTGDLDVADVSLPVAFSDIVCSELFLEDLLFVRPSAHPLAALPRLDPRRIAGEHLLVLREGHCFRKDTLAVCRRGLREPGTVFESDQFASVFAVVAGGFGITSHLGWRSKKRVDAVTSLLQVAPRAASATRRSGVRMFRQRREHSSLG